MAYVTCIECDDCATASPQPARRTTPTNRHRDGSAARAVNAECPYA